MELKDALNEIDAVIARIHGFLLNLNAPRDAPAKEFRRLIWARVAKVALEQLGSRDDVPLELHTAMLPFRVDVAYELVPLRVNKEGRIEVLLYRTKNPLYLDQWVLPGIRYRPRKTDQEMGEFVAKKHKVRLHHISNEVRIVNDDTNPNGHVRHEVRICEAEDLSGDGCWFPVDQLPVDTFVAHGKSEGVISTGVSIFSQRFHRT